MHETGTARGNSRKHCIFCGGGNLTREHIWPVWAAPLLPSGPNPQNYDVAAIYHAVTGVASQARHYRRQGAAATKRLRVVCQSCNSGWMSQLEVESRPILTPLATGAPVVLSPAMQGTLAAWIAMKTIVAQHNTLVAEVTDEAARFALRTDREVPAGLQIWLWRCGEHRWRSRYHQRAFTLATPGGDFDSTGRPNTHDVTFGFGDLLVNALYTRAEGLHLGAEAAEPDCLPLWPPHGRDLMWPPRIISAVEADQLAESLMRAIHEAQPDFIG